MPTPVEPYQKHRVAMDHLDALVRGRALTCRGILHLEASLQPCACPSVLVGPYLLEVVQSAANITKVNVEKLLLLAKIAENFVELSAWII